MSRVASLDCEEWDGRGALLRSEVLEDGPPIPREGRIGGSVGRDDGREHCASSFLGSWGAAFRL